VKTCGSAAAVIAALNDDAAAERERLERESSEAIEMLSHARDTNMAPGPPDDRMAAARRACAEADAAEDWEDTVASASDRDAWIGAVAAAGRRALASGPGAASWLERVVREAASTIPGDACVVAIPAAMLADVEAARGAVERDLRKRITLEAASLTAGCIARTPDGRVVFDNSVEARERRTHVAWRTAVARLYDEAVAAAPASTEVA
jgi:hypothetical protein